MSYSLFQVGLAALSGIARAVNESGSSTQASQGRIDRLCRELGWTVDERCGDGDVALYFNDPQVGIRKVYVGSGDEPQVQFRAGSHTILPAVRVPQSVVSQLLARNDRVPFGAWAWHVNGDGDALFGLFYKAAGDDLTAASFQRICQEMVKEASAFDAGMKAAGLRA